MIGILHSIFDIVDLSKVMGQKIGQGSMLRLDFVTVKLGRCQYRTLVYNRNFRDSQRFGPACFPDSATRCESALLTVVHSSTRRASAAVTLAMEGRFSSSAACAGVNGICTKPPRIPGNSVAIKWARP